MAVCGPLPREFTIGYFIYPVVVLHNLGTIRGCQLQQNNNLQYTAAECRGE